MLPLVLGSASQKLKPNFSLWNQGPVCPPQKPSAASVLHKPRDHLSDQGILDFGAGNTPLLRLG